MDSVIWWLGVVSLALFICAGIVGLGIALDREHTPLIPKGRK